MRTKYMAAVLLVLAAIPALSSDLTLLDRSRPTPGPGLAFATKSAVPCAGIPAGAVAWWRAESNTLDTIGINDGFYESSGAHDPARFYRLVAP